MCIYCHFTVKCITAFGTNSVLRMLKACQESLKCLCLLHGQLYKGVLCLAVSYLQFKIECRTPFHVSRLSEIGLLCRVL